MRNEGFSHFSLLSLPVTHPPPIGGRGPVTYSQRLQPGAERQMPIAGRHPLRNKIFYSVIKQISIIETKILRRYRMRFFI